MATLLYASPDATPPRRMQPDMPQKRYWAVENIQHVVNDMELSAKHAISPRQAVKRFLYDVVEVVEKTYPVWEKRLVAFLEDTPLDFEEKRKMIEIHPVRHYYYAVVVGLESAKIRSLFPTEIAEDLLAEINELIDKIAGRTDHLVSDLVFDILQRVQVTDADDTKKAHDIAMKRIADLLHLTTTDAIKDLTKDVVFRQEMGQHIAMSMRHWWKAFKNSRQLAQVVPAPTQKSAATPDQVQTFKVETIH